MFAVFALAAISPAAAQTPPPVTPVAFTSLRVVPSQATSFVRGVLARNTARFAACGTATTTGTVALRLATDANGQIGSATIRRTSFPAAQRAVASCVLSAARALRFPGSVQGTLDIEVMVTLGAPAAPPTPAAPAAH